jgi:hypothetical protein
MKKYFLSGTKKVISVFLAMIFLFFNQGCYYYKVQNVKKDIPQEIRKYDSLNKYLILHAGDTAWEFRNSEITDKELFGKLYVLPDNRMKYKTTKTNHVNRYYKNAQTNESCVINEVHLYIKDSLSSRQKINDTIRIAFSAIKKVEVYQNLKGRTTASWLVPSVAGLVFAFLIAGIIITIDKINSEEPWRI